jgi:WD40 repeat protein
MKAATECVAAFVFGYSPLHSIQDTMRQLSKVKTVPTLHDQPRRSNTRKISPRRAAGPGRDGTVSLRDVQGNAEVRQFIGHTAAVYAAAFSPNGQYVLTASDDMTARLWEAENGITGNEPTCPKP